MKLRQDEIKSMRRLQSKRIDELFKDCTETLNSGNDKVSKYASMVAAKGVIDVAIYEYEMFIKAIFDVGSTVVNNNITTPVMNDMKKDRATAMFGNQLPSVTGVPSKI